MLTLTCPDDGIMKTCMHFLPTSLSGICQVISLRSLASSLALTKANIDRGLTGALSVLCHNSLRLKALFTLLR